MTTFNHEDRDNLIQHHVSGVWCAAYDMAASKGYDCIDACDHAHMVADRFELIAQGNDAKCDAAHRHAD